METAVPSQTSRVALLAAFGVQREPASTPTAILMASPPPATIAGVRLLRKIGRGGNAEVYLGHHEALDVDVAVKLLIDPSCPALIDEGRAVAKIQHPHVVRVLNCGWEGGRAFLVMEYVPGGDLGCVLRGERCLPWQRALDLIAQARSVSPRTSSMARNTPSPSVPTS